MRDDLRIPFVNWPGTVFLGFATSPICALFRIAPMPVEGAHGLQSIGCGLASGIAGMMMAKIAVPSSSRRGSDALVLYDV